MNNNLSGACFLEESVEMVIEEQVLEYYSRMPAYLRFAFPLVRAIWGKSYNLSRKDSPYLEDLNNDDRKRDSRVHEKSAVEVSPDISRILENPEIYNYKRLRRYTNVRRILEVNEEPNGHGSIQVREIIQSDKF